MQSRCHADHFAIYIEDNDEGPYRGDMISLADENNQLYEELKEHDKNGDIELIDLENPEHQRQLHKQLSKKGKL